MMHKVYKSTFESMVRQGPKIASQLTSLDVISIFRQIERSAHGTPMVR